VGNRSSGKMGWALAKEARRRGAEVQLVGANVDLPPISGVEHVEAPTAAEMGEAVLAAFARADVVVMAAAVADYRPDAAVAGKLDKSQTDELSLRLERTDDILAELGRRRERQLLVGFAAEHGPAGLERARDKRARKGVDLLVHNDVSRPGSGFGSDDNEITLIGPGDQERAFPLMSKAACATVIVDAVEEALTNR
jgi:phosphopantothenoylcysteine decarboxylase/phosphopantothenate--cysteine ligase